MDAADDPIQWHDFALAIAGAGAALAGLLVVAVSINVREILADRHLPGRAASALISLTTPLVIAMLVLVPAQSDEVVGIELLALAVVIGVPLTLLNLPTSRTPQRSNAQWLIGSAVPAVFLVVPIFLAGLGVLTTSMGGLYWLPVAAVAAVVGGLLQAWVLLIEILR